MEWLAFIATIFGIINGFSSIPQSIKIFKRKSAKDISIIAFSLAFIGVIVWLIYGITIKNTPIITSNSAATISIGTILVGWILYGN